MATKTKNWAIGTGSATIQYGGQGDGEIIITSDPNSVYEARSMQIVVETTDGSGIQRTITVNQAAKPKIDISAAVVTASNQTYNGSAKTPTPTVTLNGTVIPSSGYDVVYSDNINAGTATITITGKGDYTGTAYGTFNIAKASRTLSFADTYMVLNTSSTGTKTATPSAGSGDGAITYSLANTTYATINSSTGAVTSKTSDGSVIVTASIAEGQNYLGATTTYTLYVFATTHDYSYSGSAKNVTLPPGTYKLECWGAQGGSNGTNSAYGITAKAGGKGGYSVGQLTIAQDIAIQVLVGGQGSASAAGYNGGGSTTRTSQYNDGTTFGYTKMGGGGGASDIRLNDGSLYSRMIVAGGGSGSAMCRRAVTSTVTSWEDVESFSWNTPDYSYGSVYHFYLNNAIDQLESGKTYRIKIVGGISSISEISYKTTTGWFSIQSDTFTYNPTQYPPSSDRRYLILATSGYTAPVSAILQVQKSDTVTDVSYDYRNGYAGGGLSSAAGNSSCQATQSTAGTGGSFGLGASQTTSNRCYVPAGAGGGWYGGGTTAGSYVEMSVVAASGGGSGFVNTAASAGNRPSGYTGLQLDSGTTYAGNTSFPSTSGGTETGHSGNGYVRITRL